MKTGCESIWGHKDKLLITRNLRVPVDLISGGPIDAPEFIAGGSWEAPKDVLIETFPPIKPYGLPTLTKREVA